MAFLWCHHRPSHLVSTAWKRLLRQIDAHLRDRFQILVRLAHGWLPLRWVYDDIHLGALDDLRDAQVGADHLGEALDLRGLTGAVEALEGDEVPVMCLVLHREMI